MTRLRGIYVALPFPQDADGRFQRDVFQRHINDCLTAGVHGFWVNGATGCSVYLSAEQRMQSLEAALDAAGNRVPVLARVSAMSLADGLALARHARQAGAVGVSALPPLVYPAGVGDIAKYLRQLQQAADLPMTYYHVPGLTKVVLDAAQLAEICHQVPLAGIKFSDIDLFKAIEIGQAAPQVSVLTGMEEVLLGAMAMQCAAGSVGAGQNFMPGPLVQLFESFERGDLAAAQRLHAGIARLAAVQGMFDFTAATYGILNRLGYHYGRAVAPMKHLDTGEVARLEAALRKVIRPDPMHEGRLIEARDLLVE